ncbi:MAG: hypothetical protein ILA19_04740 [Bacilli bacterium]|nr:hypothetical protein [Bacilli bacterium]
MMLIVMALPLMVACGGDDDSSGTQSSIVDGVNISKARKLTSLTYTYKDTYSDYICTDNYQPNYDSKGRLESITMNSKQYLKEKLSGNRTAYALRINYDLRVIEFFKYFFYNNRTSQFEAITNQLPFSLNSQGYVSQIGTISLKYDTYGYFTGIDNHNEMWNLFYKDNDLSQSLASFNSNLNTYYFSYGDNSKQGDLYYYINSSLPSKRKENSMVWPICSFIAYQAGLFGKITQNGIYVSSEKERSAFIKHMNEKNSNSEQFIFSLIFE